MRSARAKRQSVQLQRLESRLLMSAAEPVINEFMASNGNGILDEDGLKSDWIEIYNPSSVPIDLAGWHLTDDKSLPHAFTFPSTILNPGGYLLVFATGENQAVSGGELHADFKLEAGGEYLGLLRPDDTVAQQFDPFPSQIANVAYGFSSAATTSTPLLVNGSAAHYLIPADNSLGTGWTDPAFNDAGWTAASNGIGFSPAGNPSLPRETESNNDTATANSAAFNFAPSSGNLYQLAISGSTAVTVNEDWFKIGRLDPGDVLSIAASGLPGGRAGGSSNLSVELWRAGSATAVISDTDGGPGLDALINRFAITTLDTYYIRIPTQTTGTT